MTENNLNIDLASVQKKIANGELDAALAELQPVLEQEADNADANYMAAVCHRYKKNYREAQRYLDALKTMALDKGRVYQEQGHLYRAQGLAARAMASYQSACQLNPALAASWKAQAELGASQGDNGAVQQAQAQLQWLQAQPGALVSVIDLIAQGKLFKAEALCKKFLQQSPTHPEAMRLLAEIAMKLGAMQEAEFLLESATQLNPGNMQIKIDLVTLLRRRQKFQASVTAAEELLAKAPDNPQLQSIYAISKLQIGDYRAAVESFDRVLERLPEDAITHTSKGHALKTWGKNEAAIESYHMAVQCNRGYCEAWYALSNLKTYRFSDAELQDMLALEAEETLTIANRTHLYFSLGKAFEDKKDWDLAFAYYEKGNRAKKLQSSYDANRMSEELLAQRDYFSADTIAALSRSGCTDPAPIFIVGLPRAGSTLLEQILSSHSMVDGTLELPNILTMAQKLRRAGRRRNGPGYPEIIGTLSGHELRELGEQYIEETKIHRQGAAFFIDKMPNNFRHIGLIKIILPNAKIIDARRHPVACCFSGYKQLFAEGQEFSYSLDDIARYYNDYVTLMAHWDTIMPGSVLRVRNEDVIDNIEREVSRILDYCGLPFEQACLEFHKTDRAVRTASSEQVRQPLNRRGVDHWKNFEAHLDPLFKQLGKAGKISGY